MSRKTSEFGIRERDLAGQLGILPERLDEIVTIFDADSTDEWDLRENDHFIFLDKAKTSRLFSYQGAFAIAKYMDTIEKKTLWAQILEFVTRHKEKIRNAFVRQKVLENSTSLVTRNNRYFLSKKDVVGILCTSYTRLNKGFEDIQRSDNPMSIGEDFDDIEGVRFYSLSGLDKLCRELKNKLKDADRRAWCSAVEITGKGTLKLLTDEQESRERRINSAKKAAKKRDKECCQITNRKSEKYHKIDLVAHHIFCNKNYPHLAMSLDNLITLSDTVHDEFHIWNGGFDKACTLEDLVCFINALYPESANVIITLNQRKQTLGEQKTA